MEELFIGLAIGAVVAFFIYRWFSSSSKSKDVEKQSVVLMERIRTVCKFITVEGDFAEIYHYESLKNKWMNLLLGSKKAIVLIDAKAHIGFDLTKIKMEANDKKRTIVLYDFPEPELLSVETDFKYYDKKEGWANPFTSTDLTEINREAKQHIKDKIPQSGLYNEAKKQALETVQLMQKLVETIGWNLDYSALEIGSSEEIKNIE
ncbi:DUF4230 domain-containing protein [Dokdonia sp. Hel_I_53]|uniref:DUF4230 domain-containing protein n=1 Tax=Dokdonia sp. Hel_I_53 TaxID=1566287 RepID=UPI001199CB78|nr:DUF4230 domain-containing protein [Dokdonia sp. Hel_I_53]TVZ52412.1 uncharacterized protein DUF4230 [Dokdonia sp. Hel_I_53]